MKMRYDEVGKGPALILVHGLGGTGNLWGGVVPTLSRTFRVVIPDLQGSGRTPREGEISTGALATDLLELADSLGIERAHWVGHSYGALVLQLLAVKHPSRVASLALIGPFQGGPSDATRTALSARAEKARGEGLADIGSVTAQVGTSAQTKAYRPELAAFVREMVMRQDAHSYALTCEAIANSTPEDIASLRCSTLVITGDEDLTAPPQVAKALANKIAGCHFHVLPRCGHWAPVESAGEVTNLLLNFLINCSDSGLT